MGDLLEEQDEKKKRKPTDQILGLKTADIRKKNCQKESLPTLKFLLTDILIDIFPINPVYV